MTNREAAILNERCANIPEEDYIITVRGAVAKKSTESALSKAYGLTGGEYFTIDLSLPMQQTTTASGKKVVSLDFSRLPKHTKNVYSTGSATDKALFQAIQNLISSNEFDKVNVKTDAKGNETFDAELHATTPLRFAKLATDLYYMTNRVNGASSQVINPVTKQPVVANTISIMILPGEEPAVAYAREYQRIVQSNLVQATGVEEEESADGAEEKPF